MQELLAGDLQAVIIKSVSLDNFRSYKGQYSIDLDVSADRPVVIVYGKNGAGKTGFLNAILWCFYGSAFFGSSRAFAVSQMNKDAKKRKDPSMAVRVAFDHQDKKWVVERRFEYVGSGSKESALCYRGDQGGPVVSVDGDLKDDGYAAIESVLPMSAAHFHFFDGEQMRRYTRENNPEEVRTAIERILNLPTLLNAKSDLQKTLRELEDERSRIAAKNQKYSGFLEKRSEIDQELTDINSKIGERRVELDRVSEELSKVEERLARYDELKDKIDRLRGKRTEMKTLEEQLDIARGNFKLAIDKIPYAILEGILLRAVDSIRSKRIEIEKRASKEIIGRARDDALREMLARGEVCEYCGTVLGSEQKRHIADEIRKNERATQEKAEVMRVGSELLLLEEKGNALLKEAASATTEITVVQKHIATLMNRTRGVSQDLKELGKELAGTDEDLYIADRKHAQELLEMKQKKSEAVAELVRQSNALENSRDEIESELDKHSSGDSDMQEILREKNRAAVAHLAVSELIDDYVSDMKNEVERGSSEILRALTNKPDTYRAVRVGSDFTVDIVDNEGEIVSRADLSAGEQQVLALSFMGGLAKASGSNSPFLMDTPFGRLDKEHKENILGLLPELSKQVILFVTDDDLDQYEESILNHRISKIYEVAYDQENRTSSIKLKS